MPPPSPGFWRSDAFAKKPRPDARAQCLGEMPWSCRATAFKPDACRCSQYHSNVNGHAGYALGMPACSSLVRWGHDQIGEVHPTIGFGPKPDATGYRLGQLVLEIELAVEITFDLGAG